MHWEDVDEGWGRCAPTFAYLVENLHWREYLHLLDQTGMGQGTRYLDIACGAGLAVQLACERGARATGLDASRRLAALAATRTAAADIRVGDMFALPFTEAFMAAARAAASSLYQEGLGVRAEVELQCLVGVVP
jgi:predicted TPR repeat methyltransferase